MCLSQSEGALVSDTNNNLGAQGADRALAVVDGAKRETLRKLILGAAFVVPVVASFSVDGLVSGAHALSGPGCSNMAYSGRACTLPPG
jgi:hypothetical protein